MEYDFARPYLEPSRMSRPILARIDLAALRHNYQVVRRAAPNSNILAVIKANAYGHGMLRVAQALPDADGFAVLAAEEGVALRNAGIRQEILMLEGFFEANELPVLADQRISTAVHSFEQVEMLEQAKLSQPVSVFLKLNTGMNRLGFRPEASAAALARLRACPNVGKLALMTHFASADEPDGVDFQITAFQTVPAAAELPQSLANSAAILEHPQTHHEWVRAGIMLYGASPSDKPAEAYGLKPVMTLASGIIAVQDVRPGETIGYGRTFRADRPMRAGIVACGYADGYPRHAPTGTPVLVNGKRSRLLGRVSMDMLCVDLTELPEAGVGAQVTLWGEGLSVDTVAKSAGTIGYELLCALAPRVPVIEIG